MNVSQMSRELEAAEGRLAKIKKASKEVMQHALCGGSAIAIGSGMGWVNGRYGYNGHPAYLPGTEMPVDLTVGGAALGAYAFGLGGKYKELFLYSAVGAFTETGARMLFATGQQQQTNANALGAGGQAAGAIAGGQYAGAIAGGQYAGAVAGGQYAGAVPGVHYAGH